MAYDPERCEVHDAPDGGVPEGHYVNIADQVDAAFLGSVAPYRQAYAQAAGELNSLPPSERTPELKAKVETLAREAREAAFETNVELVTERMA